VNMPLDARTDHLSTLSSTLDAPAREDSRGIVHAARREPARTAEAARRVLDRVSAEVGPDRLGRYFDRQARVSLSGHRVDVTVASGFVADVVGRRFGESLRRAAAAELGLDPDPAAEGTVELRINVDADAFPEGTPDAGSASESTTLAPAPATSRRAVSLAPPSPRVPTTRPTDRTPRYRFEGLILGASNRLAVAAAKAVINAPAAAHDPGSGPLFLHGPCGVGKTHILHAAAAAFRDAHPAAVVRILTGEQFTNEFIAAVKNNTLEAFRRHVRRVHLLCVDDVHFLAAKEATQRELLHTFDQLAGSGARILLASDEPPRDIRKLSQQLVSRFVGGTVVKVDLPDHAMRVQIAKQTSARRGYMIEPAAADLLAERAAAVGGSVRDLEGLLTQVEALSLITPDAFPQGTIGVLAVRRALGLNAAPAADAPRIRRPIPLALLAAEITRALGVEVADLSGKGRHKTVVLAREMTVHLARRLTTASFPEIARSMGRENHSTALTAHKRLETALAAGELPKADLPQEFVGLTLAELADRLAARVQRAAH
jgi:chromosomal replication initiator protein